MPMRAFRTAPRSDALRVLIVEDEALVALEIEGMLAMAGHEAVAVRARDRLLARRIDRRDDDRIRIVEAGAELVEQG